MFLLVQAIINGAEKPGPTHQSFKCRDTGNFKSDDQIRCRDRAFKSLTERMELKLVIYTGYEIGSFTNSKLEGVWSYALCPPNIKKEACLECLNNTIPYLTQNCPKQKERVAWTALPKVTCIVRYAADRDITGDYSQWAWTSFSTPPNQTPATVAELEKGLIL
ncbi:hypothetical protein L1987_69739 [Smallanthus sonchifolius]|uniref:Uncharacterized protein n=1 Tax=Smallanthus sonchifolius TaxID=185202 RepID=A0ACB9B7D6_9ASTR|nr:hypothetical protein L1987_69739 [Smallanthus sonchifolius]